MSDNLRHIPDANGPHCQFILEARQFDNPVPFPESVIVCAPLIKPDKKWIDNFKRTNPAVLKTIYCWMIKYHPFLSNNESLADLNILIMQPPFGCIAGFKSIKRVENRDCASNYHCAFDVEPYPPNNIPRLT